MKYKKQKINIDEKNEVVEYNSSNSSSDDENTIAGQSKNSSKEDENRINNLTSEELRNAIKHSHELDKTISNMMKCDKITAILLIVILLGAVVGRYIYNEISYSKFE